MAETETPVVRSPYGRRSTRTLGDVPPETQAPTYYGLPAVKRSHYGWLIATYFFVGGLSGAAQLVAQVADLLGGRHDRDVVRWGRYLALLGALISPVLLIRDLHTPSRWYNMLRIFRPTSPMSLGSWALAVFGTCSGLAALGQLVADLFRVESARGFARVVGIPAGLTGMLMSVYTGVLLSATSTPFWSMAYRHLPALFGATASASATAALSLVLTLGGAPSAVLQRLDRLALTAGASQLVLAVATDRLWERERLSAPSARSRRYLVMALGTAVPLVIHAAHLVTGRRTRFVGVLTALAVLAGAFAERADIVFTGNESADRPADYLRIAGSAHE